MSGRFLCIRFPNWPIQRLVVSRPELRRTALVLTRRDARRGEIVVTCCSQAASRGVRPEMPAVEAATLCARQAVSSSRPSHLEKHDPAADWAALIPVAERCGRFSPWVGWDTLGGSGGFDWQGSKRAGFTLLEAPSALLLDLQGIVTHFGSEENLAREVLREFEPEGYQLVLGFGETIGIAWAFAHAEPTEQTSWRTLPVELLRLPAETVDLLNRLGVLRIDQLLQLPRHELPSRFGSLLLRRIDQALGTVAEWVVPHHPLARLEVERALEFALIHRETLETIMQQMLHQLSALLQQQDLGAMRVECHLRGEGTTQRLEIGLYRPSAAAQRMWDLLRLPWERTPLTGPIDHLRMCVLQTARLQIEQGTLFADLDEPHEPRDLIERLAGRLGKEAVGRPSLRYEVLPERGFQVRSLTGGTSARPAARSAKKSRSKSKSEVETSSFPEEQRGPTFLPLQRPIVLHHPPRPVRVRAEGEGPPLAICWSSGEEEVGRHWGPERLETGWWRGRSVRRDYYRVETTVGRRYWIFRQLGTGNWFWHGSF